jgi:hypothetical protein
MVSGFQVFQGTATVFSGTDTVEIIKWPDGNESLEAAGPTSVFKQSLVSFI